MTYDLPFYLLDFVQVTGPKVCSVFGTSFSNNFVVSTSKYQFDMKSIASNGKYDPEFGVYEQKVFAFFSTASGYNIVFHIPIAGIPINYNGDYNTWSNGYSPVDIWQYKSFSLGILDGSTWKRNADGSVSVNYNRGDFCYDFGVARSTSLTLKCGSSSDYTYTYFEGPPCYCK